jgi:hypothetical protein
MPSGSDEHLVDISYLGAIAAISRESVSARFSSPVFCGRG